MATAERGPGNQSHAGLVAVFDHFAFFLAVEQVLKKKQSADGYQAAQAVRGVAHVVILHRDEFGPAILLGHELHHGELMGPLLIRLVVCATGGDLGQLMQSVTYLTMLEAPM